MKNRFIFLSSGRWALLKGPLTKVQLSAALFFLLMVICLFGFVKTSFAQTHNVSVKVTKLGFSLKAKPEEVRYGDSIALSATVKGTQPEGKVIFFNGDVVLGEVVLSAEHNGVASLEVATLEVGKHILNAKYLTNAYEAVNDTASVTVTVKRAIRLINIIGPTENACVYGQPCRINASSNKVDGAILFTSMTADICSVNNDGEINLLAVGSCVIEIAQKEDSHYEANSIQYQLAVTAASMVFESKELTTTYSENGVYQLVPPASPSKGDVSYHIAESDQQVATVDGKGLVKIHDGGTVKIVVMQAAHDNYTHANTTYTLQIMPAEGGIKQIEGTGIVYSTHP